LRHLLLLTTIFLTAGAFARAQDAEIKQLSVSPSGSFSIRDKDGTPGSEIRNFKASLVKTATGKILLTVDYDIANLTSNVSGDTAMFAELKYGGLPLPHGSVSWPARRDGCHRSGVTPPPYTLELKIPPKLYDQADSIEVRADAITASVSRC
jgi:hypothetical protein